MIATARNLGALAFLGLALASCAASRRRDAPPPPPLTLEQGRYILQHWYIEQF
jgi:hypothetical protein